LFLAAASVAALPSNLSAGATAVSGQSFLTPAASVSSALPTSSAEDSRDLRQPGQLPTPWPRVAIAAGVFALVAAMVAAWKWIRHGRCFVMPPHEVALQHLAEARRLMDPEQVRKYCVAVAGILRRYTEERFQLNAPRLTTDEFLHQFAEAREDFPESPVSRLGDFLQHCDLACLGGWRYCRPDLEAMHTCAVEFVRQTASDPVAPEAGGNRSAPRHAAECVSGRRPRAADRPDKHRLKLHQRRND